MNILETTNFLKTKINLIDDLEIRGAVLDLIECIDPPTLPQIETQLKYFDTPLVDLINIISNYNDDDYSDIAVFTIELLDTENASIKCNNDVLVQSNGHQQLFDLETGNYESIKDTIERQLNMRRKLFKNILKNNKGI